MAPLKHATLHGVTLTDAVGSIRHCYTPFASYIADLPEQQLISCMAMSASPITVTERSQFSDAEPAEPQTGRHMLIQISKLCSQVDPWDLDTFQKVAKLCKLLSVHRPFWRNWRFANPLPFLTGEILHTCHKFFFNYILVWCKVLIRAHALDTHFKNLHQQVAVCHFSSGVSHVTQMTGRDHHDIERTIILVLTGIAPNHFITPICTMVEFIYQAQNPVHTNPSVASVMILFSYDSVFSIVYSF